MDNTRIGCFFLIDRTAKRTKSDDFDTVLISIDTAKMTVVRLTFPAEDHPIILVREPQGWIVSRGNTSTLANPDAVHELIGEISDIEVSSIVTDQPASWFVFGVGENQGIRVEVLGKGEQMEDFFVGRGTARPEAGEGNILCGWHNRMKFIVWKIIP